jgi:hypothetical protein
MLAISARRLGASVTIVQGRGFAKSRFPMLDIARADYPPKKAIAAGDGCNPNKALPGFGHIDLSLKGLSSAKAPS